MLVNSGSRYEAKYPSGIANFLEKLAFSVSFFTSLSICNLSFRGHVNILVAFPNPFLSPEHCSVQCLRVILCHICSPQLSMGVKMKSYLRLKNMEEYVTVRPRGTSLSLSMFYLYIYTHICVCIYIKHKYDPIKFLSLFCLPVQGYHHVCSIC